MSSNFLNKEEAHVSNQIERMFRTIYFECYNIRPFTSQQTNFAMEKIRLI